MAVPWGGAIFHVRGADAWEEHKLGDELEAKALPTSLYQVRFTLRPRVFEGF